MKESAVKKKKGKDQVTGKQAVNVQAEETAAAGTLPAKGRKTEKAVAVRRKLEDMNLLDDFLFGSVVTFPEIGERFVKTLLKTIFGREFKHLLVTAQKVLYGADTNLHGTRLDVYIEPETGEDPEGRAAVYDIEPDRKDTPADKRVLPRRVRFYHGKIAARSLNSGADYEELKDVAVIMILPFDPFGLNRMLYTVKNQCVEVPEMEYEDGASTLFLYTKGTEGIPSEALKQLLHYMENTVYENAVNEELLEIHRMVEIVKKDPEVAGMRIQLVDDVIRLTEENAGKTEQIAKLTEESAGKTEQIARLTEESAGKTEQIAKLTEEIGKLYEQLAQRSPETEWRAHKKADTDIIK